MARKPEQLTYGVDDRPPVSAVVVLGLQHAGLALMFMIYPVVAAQELGLDPQQTSALITSSIVAIAVATLLQSRRPPIGSGELAVHLPTPVLLPAMIHAGAVGGVGLIATMTLFLGVLESGVARMLRRLRTFFPPEVCGVVVLMVGVSLAHPALVRFTGGTIDLVSQRAAVDIEHLLAASATLAVIVAVAVFARGPVKLFALVFGLIAGVGLSFALEQLSLADLAPLAQVPLVGIPEVAIPTWRIEVMLLPLFALMAVINSVDNLGVLVSVQRMNDTEWKRIDLTRGSGGIQANSLGNIVAGGLGGAPVGISSAHVGLAFATSATSRVIAVAAGCLMLVSVFMPKVVGALALIPGPVVGAIMVYTAAFMMVAGMDLVLSRMLSERRIFTVGLSVLLGLSVAFLPGIYDGLPDWLGALFESELAVAALAAILLNLVFRIGIAQQLFVPVPAGAAPYEFAREFLQRQGNLWGARRDVIDRAVQAAAESLEILAGHDLVEGGMELGARFDEFNLDVFVLYRGEKLETPDERPSMEAILEDDRQLVKLAGFMIRRYADRLSQETDGVRRKLTLHFEH